ncbi:hypothetical protein [Streptomyces thermolineatus]|uniref:hypothetical protein n=1 Tax=Streptomyces thermolineatus TaxID=44033 RepID=UPI00384CFC24
MSAPASPSADPSADPSASPPAAPSAGLLPVLRTELRRGRFLWWWAALVAVQLAGLYVYRWVWQESWADLAQYVRNLAFLTGPLLAALAARHGGRDRRLGAEQLAASVPRSRLQRTVAGLLPVLVCGTAAYLTVWLVTLAAAWPSASAYGRPLVGPVVGDLGAVALFASAGYVLGRLSRSPLLAPLVAVCGYAVLLVWDVPHSSGWAQLVPVTFERHEGRLPAWWTGPRSWPGSAGRPSRWCWWPPPAAGGLRWCRWWWRWRARCRCRPRRLTGCGVRIRTPTGWCAGAARPNCA